MIYTNITGRIRRKKDVQEFVFDVCSHLMPRLKRDVDIDVTVVTKCEYNYSALCWGDRDGVEIEIARKSNDVKFTLEEMMLNLAHELVHAKQFITGDLHSSLKVWKRKDYAKTPYRKTPWEKEAYLLEDKLLNKFWR